MNFSSTTDPQMKIHMVKSIHKIIILLTNGVKVMNESDFLFAFLTKIDSQLSDVLKKLEEQFYSDTNSAINRGRQFLELLVIKVWEREPELPNELLEKHEYNLNNKVKRLYEDGYITSELERDFRYIRQVGNSAAHDASMSDIEKAFTLHKKIYVAASWFAETYGDTSLIIPEYKHPNTPSESKLLVEDTMKKYIEEALQKQLQTTKGFSLEPTRPNDSNEKKNIAENLGIEAEMKSLNLTGSHLIYQLSKLKASSLEAVDHADRYNYFKEYMHVRRPIEEDFNNFIKKRKSDKKNLILICGNVGDGKSHLIAHVRNEQAELLDNYTIINDATESNAPNKTAMETLEETLIGFSDEYIDQETENDHVILAVNMGILNNFISMKHNNYTFEKLKEFIDKSHLFTDQVVVKASDSIFDLISFGDYHMYELTNNGAKASYFSELLRKITEENEKNPFYVAYSLDSKNQEDKTIVHLNYRMLQDIKIRDRIVQVLIKTMVIDKVSISSREFLDFTADILIPSDYKEEGTWSAEDRLEKSLPAQIFKNPKRSILFEKTEKYNPIHLRSREVDDLLIKLNTLENQVNNMIHMLENKECTDLLTEAYQQMYKEENRSDLFIEYYTLIRFLSDSEFAESLESEEYKHYIDYLYAFNRNNLKGYIGLLTEVQKSIFKWQGSPKGKEDYIYIDKKNPEYLIAQKLEITPRIEKSETVNEDYSIKAFKNEICIGFMQKKGEIFYELHLDFNLYSLLRKVNTGYRPNVKDIDKAINFTQFLTKVLNLGEKSNEILIEFVKENRMYKVNLNLVGEIQFKKEEI